MRLIVTTSRSLAADTQAEAARWAERLDAPVVPRAGKSLAELVQEVSAEAALVISGREPRFVRPGDGLEYFFHPNMAKIRLHNIVAGRGDPMLTAMALQPGDTVLDCTLGRGSDAIVASHVAGEAGRVVGLEIVPIIAALTRHGLRHYESGVARLDEPMRRIEVHCADYRPHLAGCEPGAFDVVYFDPIFTSPVEKSQSMIPLRALADKGTVTPDVLAVARRVARRRVVVKNVVGSRLWTELGIVQLVKGSSSRIEYGIVEAQAS
ncbi:MAG: class I SAM-dependent methyltransferase [Armatimonadota bacterium]